jgi:hypothetical protein
VVARKENPATVCETAPGQGFIANEVRAMTIHFCPRPLNAHWPDAGAAWRSRADFDALEAGFAAQWRADTFATWRATRPVKGTLGELYLRGHGIHLAPPASLRFHVKLEHFAGGSRPALVALVTDGRSGVPLGVHVIYLSPDGLSLAPVKPPTVTLGPCDSGVVRLGEPSGGDMLMVGTGLLSCLGAMQNAPLAAWAALSERDLATLELPRQHRDVILLAGDNTDATQAAASRWKSQGRRAALAASLLETESCGCSQCSGADAVH